MQWWEVRVSSVCRSLLVHQHMTSYHTAKGVVKKDTTHYLSPKFVQASHAPEFICVRLPFQARI